MYCQRFASLSHNHLIVSFEFVFIKESKNVPNFIKIESRNYFVYTFKVGILNKAVDSVEVLIERLRVYMWKILTNDF